MHSSLAEATVVHNESAAPGLDWTGYSDYCLYHRQDYEKKKNPVRSLENPFSLSLCVDMPKDATIIIRRHGAVAKRNHRVEDLNHSWAHPHPPS